MYRIVGAAVGLMTIWLSADACGQQPPGKVVYLRNTYGWELRTQGNHHRGMLSKELARQAFLITAREELGLTTRDASLGDEMPKADDKTLGGSELFEIAGVPGDTNQIEILYGIGAQQVLLWRKDLPSPGKQFDYRGFCTEMEALSRTDFVAVLKKNGLTEAPAKVSTVKTERLPVEIADLLDEMTFTSQVSAVRQLHAALAAERDSRLLLAGLVRGYANLGVLSESNFHPMHKVFKARSLLYAQRLVATAKQDSSWAFYHRAYGEALAGLHNAALEDLDHANRALAEENKNGAGPPVWAAWIRNFCRFEQNELAAANTNSQQLPALLRYLSAEQSGSPSQAARIGLEVLPLLPEWYRLHDGLSDFSGPGLAQHTTQLGPQTLADRIYGQVAKIPELPTAIKRSLKAGKVATVQDEDDNPKEYEQRAALVAQLRTAGLAEPLPKANSASGADQFQPDRSELSWTVLSELIQETSFSQLWRRLRFERQQLGVSSDDTLAATVALVEKHRLRAFVESFASNKKVCDAALQRLKPATNWFSIDLSYQPIFDVIGEVDPGFRSQLFNYAPFALDDDAKDLDFALQIYKPQFKSSFAHGLYAISSHSPAAKQAIIQYDPKWADTRIESWQKNSANQPVLAMALGKRLSALKRCDEAEKQFRASIAAEPAMQAFEALADSYLQQGQQDKWQSTLEEFLQHPDYGLEHAQIRAKIADYYMSLHEWKKAQPFAEAAAVSVAQWAMNDAGIVYEALQDWDRAEAMYRATSERYSGEEFHWFCFCKRTGHGDVAAAKDLVVAARAKPSYRPKSLDDDAFFHLLTGEPLKALELCEQALDQNHSPAAGLRTALIADQLGETDRRDRALQHVVQQFSKFKPDDKEGSRTECLGLAKLWIADLARGGKADFDLKSAERLAQDANPSSQMNFNFYLASYLDLHGRNLSAIEYWKRAVCARNGLLGYNRTLAGIALLKYQITPKDYAADMQRPIAPSDGKK